jgi:pyridoxine 5-phosphate synthase
MTVRLSVNIDHVATVREARKANEPDPVAAVYLAQTAGADGITLHLRGDRRHINERDLSVVMKTALLPVTLEMAATNEMVSIAVREKPHIVTLVPERQEEITTEGGMDMKSNFDFVKSAVLPLQQAGIRVCIFVNPDMEQIGEAKRAGAEMTEINTGIWARSEPQNREWELTRIKKAMEYAVQIGLTVTAGHDITYRNVSDIASIPGLYELSIGHTIVSRALFTGFERAVRDMKELLIRLSAQKPVKSAPDMLT